MADLVKLLTRFARRPDDVELNYSIALEYETLGQTASALSYFLRAAERSHDKLLAYECLLKIGLCFERQGKRGNSVRGAYKHAICLLPWRPEAYFLLARYYERIGDHVSGYLFAEQGLVFSELDSSPCSQSRLRSSVEYPGRYGLIFQKAVSAWWWGKPDESRKLFLQLWNEYPMDAVFRPAVENNLKILGISYPKLPDALLPRVVIIDNKRT